VFRAFGISDKGRVRPTNEDCFAVDEALNLCVVADGMGGHNAGEVAARMAVDAVVDFVRRSAARPDDWAFGFDAAMSIEANVLRTAIHVANAQILDAAIAGDAYAGMGTTVVAAQIAGERLSVAHVGDSRLYLLAPSGLFQVTHDDSWLATFLAQDPDADPAILQDHPMRHALTNVVGARARTHVHVVEQMLSGGELLLLSTDGVHGVVDEPRIAELLREEDDVETIARRVIASALARGSRDNCTAVVARYTHNDRMANG
jgi:PPM family protein phosphatase